MVAPAPEAGSQGLLRGGGRVARVAQSLPPEGVLEKYPLQGTDASRVGFSPGERGVLFFTRLMCCFS